jgi:hypothetical protein
LAHWRNPACGEAFSKYRRETAMRRLVFSAALLALALATAVSAFAQSESRAPAPQNEPRHFDSQAQRDQNLSNRLERSDGVIAPPTHVDPDIHVSPPATGDKMPVVPPPGSPGGDQSVRPK